MSPPPLGPSILTYEDGKIHLDSEVEHTLYNLRLAAGAAGPVTRSTARDHLHYLNYWCRNGLRQQVETDTGVPDYLGQIVHKIRKTGLHHGATVRVLDELHSWIARAVALGYNTAEEKVAVAFVEFCFAVVHERFRCKDSGRALMGDRDGTSGVMGRFQGGGTWEGVREGAGRQDRWR